jgi:hypothetical protein
MLSKICFSNTFLSCFFGPSHLFHFYRKYANLKVFKIRLIRNFYLVFEFKWERKGKRKKKNRKRPGGTDSAQARKPGPAQQAPGAEAVRHLSA